jgi:hypothetical protein
MRDLLIRYLMGELDDDEQQRLEERLRNSSELRRDLACLRSCFLSADEAEGAPTPAGLARRTAERVTDYACGAICSEHNAELPSAAMIDPPSSTPRWSLADLTVAAGVCLAVSMLLLPAIRDSRDAARRRDCQNNLRQMHVLLANYAQQHGGFFPRVGPEENAGIYVVRLVDEGYVSAEEMADLRLCGGSPQADEIRAGRITWRLPATYAELRAMSPQQLAEARKAMSWSYAYRFPYRVGNRYYDVPDQRSPHEPLLADAPCPNTPEFTSPNHGGCIVQVLFQDGSVRLLKRCTVPNLDDHLYKNSQGMAAAGCGRRDAVLGRSEAIPGIQFIGKAQ